MSPHASPIALNDGYVFVVNTSADTIDVIDTDTRTIIKRINVGIDPVSIAVRPDGKEAWVANHVSDSVSVIDTDSANPTWMQVIATVQDLDPETRATRFDEPVGIAFANNDKAYVALSSENQIAVINVETREVRKRLTITAQDPRAITVRGDRLYVIPFLHADNTTMTVSGRHIQEGAYIIVDGRRVSGTITSQQGKFFDMDIIIKLETLPSVGMHFLQIQNPAGMFSNDFIFHVSQEKMAEN